MKIDNNQLMEKVITEKSETIDNKRVTIWHETYSLEDTIDLFANGFNAQFFKKDKVRIAKTIRTKGETAEIEEFINPEEMTMKNVYDVMYSSSSEVLRDYSQFFKVEKALKENNMSLEGMLKNSDIPYDRLLKKARSGKRKNTFSNLLGVLCFLSIPPLALSINSDTLTYATILPQITMFTSFIFGITIVSTKDKYKKYVETYTADRNTFLNTFHNALNDEEFAQTKLKDFIQNTKNSSNSSEAEQHLYETYNNMFSEVFEHLEVKSKTKQSTKMR